MNVLLGSSDTIGYPNEMPVGGMWELVVQEDSLSNEDATETFDDAVGLLRSWSLRVCP
jgi:hypothetical protein